MFSHRMLVLRFLTFLYLISSTPVYGLYMPPQSSLVTSSNLSLGTQTQAPLPRCGFGPQACIFSHFHIKGNNFKPPSVVVWREWGPERGALPAPEAWVVITWRGHFPITKIGIQLIQKDSGQFLWRHDSNAPSEHDGTNLDGSIRFRMPSYPQGTRGLLGVLFDTKGLTQQFMQTQASDITTLMVKFNNRPVPPEIPLCRCM